MLRLHKTKAELEYKYQMKRLHVAEHAAYIRNTRQEQKAMQRVRQKHADISQLVPGCHAHTYVRLGHTT